MFIGGAKLFVKNKPAKSRIRPLCGDTRDFAQSIIFDEPVDNFIKKGKVVAIGQGVDRITRFNKIQMPGSSSKIIDGAKSHIPPLCGGICDFAGQ
jgi:hypothetical protein